MKLLALLVHLLLVGYAWGQSTSPKESNASHHDILTPDSDPGNGASIKVGGSDAAASPADNRSPENMTEEYAIAAGLKAGPNGPLHFPDGASTFLRQGGRDISATDLMRLDLKVINEMLYNLDAYRVTKGVIRQEDFDRLPQSSKDIVLDHTELFIIQ